MKKWEIIVSATVVHLAASLYLFLVSFGIGMHHMDTGVHLRFGEKAVCLLSDILFLPIFVLKPHWFPGLWGYIPFILNSLVWGIATWLAYSWFMLKLRIPKQAPRIPV
jgi:hypothetical protein